MKTKILGNLILRKVSTLLLVALYITAINSIAQKRSLPADTAIVSTDKVVVKGTEIPYKVTTGTQPVYGEDGEADAALFYTFYERTDVENNEKRPIFISFNGGPGAGSLWMHLGYTSPKRLIIDDEGYPIQPYGIQDNPHSIIDVADIVYVNPVNTGFSRILNDGKKEQFFGVNEDLAYLADWIDNFISRNERWRSPKYLI
ncbi:MAG: carboxypeptidase, partial [Balneola sp.]